MTHEKKSSDRSRTSEEIEALLRESAADEQRVGSGRVTRGVTATLRRDSELRQRGAGLRVGAMFDDDGGVPRWYAVAAAVAITAIAGWMVFGPSGGTTGTRGPSGSTTQANEGAEGGDQGETRDVPLLSAKGLMARALESPTDPLRREAEALMGAGRAFAERVFAGIPAEFVRPQGGDAQSSQSGDAT